MPAKIIQIRLTFDRNDKLRNNWKNFCTTFVEHVECSLYRQESVWLLLLTDSFKEDWEVVMVIERHDINFPSELILRTMIDGDWKISSVIETAELRWRNYSSVGSSCFWFGTWSLFFWSEQG